MRRRIFPNLIGDFSSLEERQARLERILQIIGFSPELPYTLTVNDGTRNRVLIGKINGDYGIKIVDNSGNEIILADGTIVADAIKSGTLDCSLITVTNLDAGSITTGDLSATRIVGGTLDCGGITVQSLNAASITVGQFADVNDRFGDTSIHGDKIQTGTLAANRIEVNSITAGQIEAHSISGNELSFHSITGDHMIVNNLAAISADLGEIHAGSMDADRINAHTITTDHINYLHADRVDRGEMSADRIAGGLGRFNGVWVYDWVVIEGDIQCHTVKASDDLEVSNNIYIKAPWHEKGFNCGQDGWVTQTWWFREDLWVHGDFGVSGSKGFIIEHPENPEKYVQYSSHEGPEVLLRIRGKGKLAKGYATIELPHHWTLVTEEDELSVMLTPAGDCNGLFVELDSITQESFTVKELQGGESDTDFFWEALAVRKGYKEQPIIIDKRDHSKQKGNPEHIDYQLEKGILNEEEYNVAKESVGAIERKSEKRRESEIDLVNTLIKMNKKSTRDSFEEISFREISPEEVNGLRKEANDTFLSEG